MMDDIVTHKSQAKEDIKNALIGLLIIIGAVVILNTINSNLTNNIINVDALTIDDERDLGNISDIDQFIAMCNDIENTGGCSNYTCEVLFDELVSYATVGCAISGGAGAIVGGLGGLGIGCVSGALVGGLGGMTLDETTCRVGCDLAGGHNASNGHCYIPNNSEIFTKIQLQQMADARDLAREETKIAIAEENQIDIADTLSYFGLETDVLTEDQFGLPVLSITDIDPEHRTQLCLAHDTCYDVDIDNVQGKFIIYKQLCTLAECAAELETYNQMQANLEVAARENCKNGEVMKIEAFDDTNVLVPGTETRTTTLYCLSS